MRACPTGRSRGLLPGAQRVVRPVPGAALRVALVALLDRVVLALRLVELLLRRGVGLRGPLCRRLTLRRRRIGVVRGAVCACRLLLRRAGIAVALVGLRVRRGLAVVEHAEVLVAELLARALAAGRASAVVHGLVGARVLVRLGVG